MFTKFKSFLDIKTLIILGLVAYIGISLVFGIGTSNRDLKKENKELHKSNEELIKKNLEHDKNIIMYRNLYNEKTNEVEEYKKNNALKDKEIEKLKKGKYEKINNIDKLSDAELIKFLSSEYNK